MRAVLRAQGACDVDEGVLNNHIVIRVWENGSFEFSHFTDRELATALSKLDRRATPATVAQIEAALSKARDNSQDVKQVYTNWRPEPSKVELAETLWPVLKSKIEQAQTNDDLPEIAQVAIQAYTELGARFGGVWHLPKSQKS